MPKSVFSPAYDRLRRMLVDVRERAGLTQTALAKRLGRPQSYVAKYEGGERRLDVVEFLEIAEALGVRPERFIADLRRAVRNLGGSSLSSRASKVP